MNAPLKTKPRKKRVLVQDRCCSTRSSRSRSAWCATRRATTLKAPRAARARARNEKTEPAIFREMGGWASSARRFPRIRLRGPELRELRPRARELDGVDSATARP